MPTLNQLVKGIRKKKNHKCRTVALKGNPQRKGTVLRVFFRKPKKPNSAIRKIAKVFITYGYKRRNILTAIPGQGFTIKKFSEVLVRGGRIRDVPGVRYKLIKGVYDFSWQELILRRQSRSKYGIPKGYK